MNFLNKLQAKDVIAAIALVVLAVLKLNGVNGQVDIAIALILGYYFAHRKDGTDRGE